MRLVQGQYTATQALLHKINTDSFLYLIFHVILYVKVQVEILIIPLKKYVFIFSYFDYLLRLLKNPYTTLNWLGCNCTAFASFSLVGI